MKLFSKFQAHVITVPKRYARTDRRTDGRTDDMQCTVKHRAVKKIHFLWTVVLSIYIFALSCQYTCASVIFPLHFYE